MKFGENLYNLRKMAKMSQEKLAEKMNVTRQSVSKWENGESYPEMEKIMKLCDIFHCKINDLVHENMVDINSLDEDIKMSVVKFKEEKQKKIKGISKAIYVLARIGKIACKVAIPIIILIMIATPFFLKNIEVENNELIWNGSNDKFSITDDENKITLKYNDNIILADDNSQSANIKYIEKFIGVLNNNSKYLVIGYIEVGFICVVISVFLYEMILSRLEKLFINISQGDTPFTLENVKYIKDMAKLMLLILILPNLGGIIFEKIFLMDLNIGFEAFDVVQIVFIFGISYIFEYGYELQQDTKAKMYGEVSDN